MKRIIISGCLLALALMAVTSTQARNKVQKTFLFGFAASFNDSTVYFTDIQELDSAWVNEKNKFLVSRENYSYQLRDYLTDQGERNRTCVVSFSDQMKKAQKKRTKMIDKYTRKAKGKFDVKYLTAADFKFHSVAAPDTEEETKPATGKKK